MGEDQEDTDKTVNEKTKDEALKKLKELAESMGQKKRRKAKLGTISHGRLSAWRRLRWTAHKKWTRVHHSWQHDFSNFRIFQRSLQKIEVRCGTAIVNVFLFVRWSLFLNLLIALLCIFIIIIPFLVSNRWIIKGISPGEDCELKDLIDIQEKSNLDGWENRNERMRCCVRKYALEANQNDHNKTKRGGMTELVKLIFRSNTIEDSPLFYGYYVNNVIQVTDDGEEVKYDWFAFGYVMVVLISLGISLFLMVRSVGHGIKEMVMASEGDHNPFTSLIFAGWDHYTKDEKSAEFKRKILCHEMLVALNNEKETLEKVLRSKKEQVKLVVLRILVNLIWLLMSCLAGAAIYYTSDYTLRLQQTKMNPSKGTSLEEERVNTALRDFFIGFAPSMLISVLNIMFPLILARVGTLEKYSAHTATACVLYRSLVIRLMSIISAAASLYVLKYCELVSDKTCTRCNPDITKNKEQTERVACWESIFADQLYKLLLADFVLKVVLTMIIEPFRLQLKKWFKNKLIQKIGTMKFSVVRHSLDVIYVQVICWIGMYFAPFIPILCVIYSYIVFYIKRFSLFHNCIQVPDTSRTMKTTTTFVAAKLMSFMAVCIANVYVIGDMTPSRGCGPFRQFNTSWGGVVEVIKTSKTMHGIYQTIASPAVTLPITLILILIGYYLYSVVQANRGMVETLRHLLILEGHDKQYLFARLNSLRRGSSSGAAANHAGTGGARERVTLDALNIVEIEHKVAAPRSQEQVDKDDKSAIEKKKKN